MILRMWMKMKSRVCKLYTGAYVVLNKITAFGPNEDDDGYLVATVDGTTYEASENDIKMIAALLS